MSGVFQNIDPPPTPLLHPASVSSPAHEAGGGVPQNTYFPRDEAGIVCLPTQLERTLQLYW